MVARRVATPLPRSTPPRAVLTALDAVASALAAEAASRSDATAPGAAAPGAAAPGAVWRELSRELACALHARATPREVTAHSVPVCAWLDVVAAQARVAAAGGQSAGVRALLNALLIALPQLPWSRNASYVDEHFLARYGYCELLGAGPWPSERVRAGVLLLAPDTHYPPHAHAAEEIYLVLAGAAQWRIDARAVVLAQAADTFHHPAHAVHSMRTLTEPLLALYVWRGAIAEPAHLIT